MTRAEAAAKDIRKESGNDLVEVAQLDLASLKSVRKCAESLLEKEDKIDYLINNAGMICLLFLVTIFQIKALNQYIIFVVCRVELTPWPYLSSIHCTKEVG